MDIIVNISIVPAWPADNDIVSPDKVHVSAGIFSNNSFDDKVIATPFQVNCRAVKLSVNNRLPIVFCFDGDVKLRAFRMVKRV